MNFLNKFILGSSIINGLIIFTDTNKIKLLKDESSNIKRPILLTERIVLSCIGGICFWQAPFRILNKIQLIEIYLKGYDKKDFGYIEKNTHSNILFDLS